MLKLSAAPVGKVLAGAMTLALAVSVAPATASPASASPASSSSVSSSDVKQTGPNQQRWLSVPGSRIVLNPYDSGGSGTQVDQTSGPDLPLSTGYYVADQAEKVPDALQLFRVSADPAPPTPPDEVTNEYVADFGAVETDDWTKDEVTAVASGTQAKVTVGSSPTWGNISQSVTISDVAKFSQVSVTVPATTGKWALKINTGGRDDAFVLQDDTDQTGTFTYDLAGVTGWTGSQEFSFRLYASGAGSTTTFAALSVHTSEFPDAGQTIAFADDFNTADGWSTASVNGNDTTMASDGNVGTVTLGSGAGYGAVEAQLTDIDLDTTSFLSVKVTGTTGKWAIKLYVSGNNDAFEVQHDSSDVGTFTYDLSSISGWTGTHSFRLKLYQIGDQGSTTSFDRVSVHSQTSIAERAASHTTSWNPQALGFSATYADGTVTGSDLFVDQSSVVRLVQPDLSSDGRALSGGTYQGATTYDSGTQVITVVSDTSTRAIALPSGATVLFYPSLAALQSGASGSTTPSGTSGFWAATPADNAAYAIAMGFAVGTDSAAAADAQQSATAAASVPAATGAMAEGASFWDDYLTQVPAPEDFSIHPSVNPVGVTSADVKRMYYRAWVDLQMNVLPPTPETGNDFAQLSTGKPSLWLNGTPGTKSVASWDSLLGMQALVYVDPDDAWASFQGMMALVGQDGSLGGESLPSRKAQTAWILYNVTGDRDKLADTYDALSRHLTWESHHLRWILGHNDYADERDSEFVVSLIVDLEYAQKIATTLGDDADVTSWAALRDTLLGQYEEWFFPGKGTTLQKIFLDASHPQDSGTTMYVATGLRIADLPAYYVDELTSRFYRDYQRKVQFAGLAGGESGIKAPDAQFITYGLLGHGMVEQADVLVNSMTRDMVRSHWFAEVYKATSDNLNGEPEATGVRPSLFGIANLIDNVWINNGYRLDAGEPTFVRMPDANGGVHGLTYLGQELDVSLDGTSLSIDGAAVPGPNGCTMTTTPGQSVEIADVCAPESSHPVGDSSIAVVKDAKIKKAQKKGKVRVGKKLTVTRGKYDPADVTVKYRWFSGGDKIKGKKGKKKHYKIRKADKGSKLRVKVKVKKPGYEKTTYKTAKTVKVAKGKIKVKKKAKIKKRHKKNKVRVGKKLTVTKGKYQPKNVKIKYRWFAGGDKIKGKKGKKKHYKIRQADKGSKLRVKVKVKKKGYKKTTYKTTTTVKARG